MRAPAERSSETELLPSTDAGACGASFSDTVHLGGGKQQRFHGCNLPAEFTIVDISSTCTRRCKAHRGAVRSAPRDFRDQWRVHCATSFAPRRGTTGSRAVASPARRLHRGPV